MKQDLDISDEEFEKLSDRLFCYLLILKENFCAKVLLRKINLKQPEIIPLSRYMPELQRRFAAKLYDLNQKRHPIDEEELVNIFAMLEEFRINQNNYGMKLGISILEDIYIVPAHLRKIYHVELCKIIEDCTNLYWLEGSTKQMAVNALKTIRIGSVFQQQYDQEKNKNKQSNRYNFGPEFTLDKYYGQTDNSGQDCTNKKDSVNLEGMPVDQIITKSDKAKGEFDYQRDLKTRTLWFNLGETYSLKKAIALMKELLVRTRTYDGSEKNIDTNFSNMVRNYCKGIISEDFDNDVDKYIVKMIFHGEFFKQLNLIWNKNSKFEILKKKGVYLLIQQIAEEVCQNYLDIIFEGHDIDFFEKGVFQDIAGWAEFCTRALVDCVNSKNHFETAIVEHKNKVDRYLVGNNIRNDIKSWEEIVHDEFKLYYQYLTIKEFQVSSKDSIDR